MPGVFDTRRMETVGGYRLVRKLGAGERAQTYLGHAGTREPPAGDRIAAIKVYRPATDDASIDREIEALARASSRHLLELKDLATGPDGRPCLILPRLGSGTLGRLLAVRGTVAPGEAVSILVPLVQAVQELHRVGVAHGAVTPGSVLFDDRGAPVLARFGAVALIGDFPMDGDVPSLTPAQLDGDPRAIADCAGLQILIETVLDRLEPGSLAPSLDAIRQELYGPPPGAARLSDFINLLFELAPALPIRFDEQSLESVTPPPSIRPGPHPMSSIEVLAADGLSSRDPAGTAVRPFGRVPSSARAVEVVDTHPFALLRERTLALLAPVRMPVWIAGGAGIGALVVALTVIPAAPSDTATGSPEAAPTTSSSALRQSAQSTPTPSGSAGATTPGAKTTGAKTTAKPEAARSAIEGDDPLAAARALLAARVKCFAAKSAACFDSVDQAGSAVIEADRDLVRRLKSGATLPTEATLDGFTPHLIQQLGDSAIIQLVAADGTAASTKNPAPLLLVRSETGWRIRDLALG
jgi:hypothetical protein